MRAISPTLAVRPTAPLRARQYANLWCCSNMRQENPSGSAVTTSEAVGNKIIWSGQQRGLFTISGRANDMRRQALQGVTLELRYRVDRCLHAPFREHSEGITARSLERAATIGAALSRFAV